MPRKKLISISLPVVAIFVIVITHSVARPESNSPAPTVQVTKVSTPITIDGVMSDGEWSSAERIELGYQVQPGDNAPPTERSEFYLTYTSEHLYVAFRAFDSDPSAIRARVSRREDIFNDDYFAVYLDTYDDRRRAYVFYFNPLGIQADGIYTEGLGVGRDWGRNVDLTWDGILESKGALTSDGYIVEAAIPFKTMRFQAGKERRWGLHVQRWIARKAENIHWRPISRDVSALLIQMGAITGLDEIYTGRALDIIPTVTLSATGDRRPDRRFDNVNKFDPGLTAVWAITPNLILSAAANPDFSQIEADVPQIEVNQRFPLFFPDKRPFFFEGDQYFRSPGALTFLNTRQIVDPDWGIKLTGKIGANTIGALSASDRAPGLSLAVSDADYRSQAYFNILRYQRDIMKGSTIGAFITAHRFARSSNTVMATDGQIRFARVNVLGFQGAYSKTKELDGTSKDGAATYTWLEHQGRHLRLFVNDLRLASDYNSLAGFVRRTGIRSNSANLGYEFQREKSWFVTLRPFTVIKYAKTSEGLTDESYVDPGVDLTLPRAINLYIYRSFHIDSFVGREFPYRFNVVDYTINTFKKVSFEGRFQFGEGVNFDPASPKVGDSLSLTFQMTITPNNRLNTETLYLKSNLKDKSSGARLFNQEIFRNRTIYQFNRDNAVRSIIEYDTARRRAGVSLLYSYTPRPNTALFVGYNDLIFNGFDPLLARRSPGLVRLRRTFFAKLSYNFRF